MTRTAGVRTGLGVVAAVLLLAGCGSERPARVVPVEPVVPADLCALVPASTRTGLVTSATTDDSGQPTAACSLRSPEGDAAAVQAVVTWVQLDDELSARDVLDSQCRAVDTTQLRAQAGFRPQGTDRACAATGSPGGRPSTTMSAVADREVVTVRLTAGSGSPASVTQRAQQMLEGVVRQLAAGPS